MAEPSASESSAGTDSDQDFDPTAEMLVNDFDDEHTLDEEEAIDGDTNASNEVDDLQKEGEMPLEELLALYGYSDKVASSSDKSVERAEATSTTPMEAHSSTDGPNASHSLVGSYSHAAHLRSSQPFTHINNQNMVSDSSDSESEDDFSINEEDWRRTIQVGSDYQASIPEGLCRYDGAPAYENEDRLLWDPSPLEDEEIEEYLRRFQQSNDEDAGDGVVSSTLLPTGSHTRDDEQALYLLHQCGHNVEEALRRRRMTANLPAINESMTSWSEDECKTFEAGLRMYGKDFHLIQINKVRTRSVGELVQFYYLWKKTERHDVFATKCRMEKKKYSLHPGTTDYMDRFLDEQENMALTVQASLSSSSLNNIQSSNTKQLHSYRSSPSTQTSSPVKPDLLVDDLSPFANLTTFCDSGGDPSIITGGTNMNMTGFVNGFYTNKTSDSVLCGGAGNNNSSNNNSNNNNISIVAAKVCHASIPNITSEWVSSQHQQSATSTTSMNGPDVRNVISSTTIITDTNNIHSFGTATSNNSSN